MHQERLIFGSFPDSRAMVVRSRRPVPALPWIAAIPVRCTRVAAILVEERPLMAV